jgi:hypothetical protein
MIAPKPTGADGDMVCSRGQAIGCGAGCGPLRERHLHKLLYNVTLHYSLKELTEGVL